MKITFIETIIIVHGFTKNSMIINILTSMN